MKNKMVRSLLASMAVMMTVGTFAPMSVQAESVGEWKEENGLFYWYENGVKQGYDENDPTYRGKEIFDPSSNAWYWLDNVQGGAKAVNKDVYQESMAGAWGDYVGEDGQRYGKWVRYDENGHMIKGWSETESGTYYFDETYGTMAKGYATIGTKEYYFNEGTGVLEREIGEVPENGWKTIDGSDYWYEGFVRQGYSLDDSYRGKEIFDPSSNAWYWLDNVDDGKKAVSKDVYQESLSGDWGDIKGEDGQKYGKWVRYDENGHMIKGWSTTENGTYYFDETYGTMAKGKAKIGDVTYQFNKDTGLCEGEVKEEEQLGLSLIKDEDVLYSGELDGGVIWKISNEGLLVITGTCGADGLIPKTYVLSNGYASYEWRKYKGEITSAYVDVKGTKDLSNLFLDLSNLTTADLSHLDTSQVTSMESMFQDCFNLTSLDLSSFNTENVTNMSHMFSVCKSLTSIDLSSFDTGNVTDMWNMFAGCNSLGSLDLSSFDTKNVTNMSGMFGCKNLTSIDLSSFDTRNVTNMSAMFSSCESLGSLDLSKFNTERVTNMESMFSQCRSLTSINLSSFKTENVTNMMNMFFGCNNLSSLDLSGFDAGNVTDMRNMFGWCQNLSSLNLSNFEAESAVSMDSMFEGCSSLGSLDLGSFNTGKATSMMNMFKGCSNLSSIDLKGFNTENVTYMNGMFEGCSSLGSLDLSNFDTKKVMTMGSMFKGCSSLTSLDLTNFDTTSLEYYGYNDMFVDCANLKEILVSSNWYLAHVGMPVDMFKGCGTDQVTLKE